MSQNEEGVGYCPFCRTSYELSDNECSYCGAAIKELFLEWLSNPGPNPGRKGEGKASDNPDEQESQPEDENAGNAKRLKKCNDLLKKNVKDIKAWFAKGLILTKTNSYEDALECFDVVLKLDEKNAGALNAKAIIYKLMGKTDEAAHCYKKALELTAPETIGKYGVIIPEDKAIEEFLKAPDEEELEKKFMKELEDYELLLKKDPKDADAWFSKALVLSKMGRYENAMKALHEVTRLDLWYPDIWKIKGDLFRKLGDEKKAKVCYKRAEELISEGTACPVCGRFIPAEASVCPECGAELEVLEEEVEEAKPALVQPPAVPKPKPLIPTKPLMPRKKRGLINGFGKINGLINGVKTGRINGLINGLHSVKEGLTNGLTNGDGLTNGLSSPRFHKEIVRNRWKMNIIPLIALILILPSFLIAPFKEMPYYRFSIDGEFEDWTDVVKAEMPTILMLNPNINFMRTAVEDNGEHLAFFIEVEGDILSGELPPGRTVDTFYIFIDSDQRRDTGYKLENIGADRLIRVHGWQGTVYDSSLWTFDSTRGAHDWNGWLRGPNIRSEISDDKLETQVDWLALGLSDVRDVDVYFYAQDYSGQEKMANFVVGNSKGILHVVQTPVLLEVVDRGNTYSMLKLDIDAKYEDIAVENIILTRTGTASVTDTGAVTVASDTGAAIDASGTFIDEYVNLVPTAPFPISRDTTETLYIKVEISQSAAAEKSIGIEIVQPHDIGVDKGTVELKSAPPNGGQVERAYIESIPDKVTVDGAFADWNDVTSNVLSNDGPYDDIDIRDYRVAANSSALSLYLEVYGTVLNGTHIPYRNTAEAPPAEPVEPAPVDSDRDGVPDDDDTYPHDFDNDAVLDVDTGNDYDGDGIKEHPYGDDYWLETTIPNDFPEKYRGKSAKVYVGPTEKSILKGEDKVHAYIDQDKNAATGYKVDGLGADYMVSVSGRFGEVLSSNYYEFDAQGGTPWLEKGGAAADLDSKRLEAQLDPAGIGLQLGDEFDVAFRIARWDESAADYTDTPLSETVKSFMNTDGILTIASGALDLNIQSYNGKKYDYKARNNGLSMYFKKNGAQGDTVKVESDKLYLTWQPKAIGYGDGNKYLEVIEVKDAIGKMKKNKFSYEALFPNSIDEYVVEQSKLKHNLILSEMPKTDNDNIITFDYYGYVKYPANDHLYVDNELKSEDFVTSSKIELRGGNGESMYLLAPYAYELSNPGEKVRSSYEVRFDKNNVIMAIKTPYSWLSNPDRVYPVVIDPTIEATTSSGTTTAYSNQRKVFHDGTYYWAFYYNGTAGNTTYEYSVDGVSWTSTPGYPFPLSTGVMYSSIWFVSPSTVYLVGDSGEGDTEVEVTKGSISGTSITWDTEVEVTIGGKNYATAQPFITRDKDGHLWIATNNQETTNPPTYYNIGVVNSTNTDDITTWNTFTYMIAEVADPYIYPTVVPFTGTSDGINDTMVVWYENGNLASRKFVGGSWSAIYSLPDATTTAGVYTKIPSVIAETNTDAANARIHALYIDAAGAVKHTYFADRTAVAWTAGQTIDPNAGNEYPSLTIDPSTGDLYALYVRSGQIYCNVSSSPYATWTSVAMPVTTGISNLTSVYSGAYDTIYAVALNVSAPNFDVVGHAIPEFGTFAGPIFIQVLLVLFFVMMKKRRSRKKEDSA